MVNLFQYNTRPIMKINFFIILTLIFSTVFGQKSNIIDKKDFVIGETLQMKSEILNEYRILNIYLPNSYKIDSLKKYPVIYLLDGSKDEDFIHISGIVQFGSFSWIDMLPESIVVGIGNIDRERDFTYPSTNELDKKDFPTSGKSENFIKFIDKELQPLIDLTYRTTNQNTLIGQSLGGLLGSEILFNHPNLFDNYIIVSPSLWWDNELLLKTQPINYLTEKSIYIAVGKEGKVMERTAKELYEKLKSVKNENTKLYFDFLDDKSHGDALHLAVYRAFENFYKSKGE